MKCSRTELLIPELKIPACEVRWYFLSDFYDGPIAGLVHFRRRIFRFCCFQEDIPHQRIFVLQELSDDELVEEKKKKAKFERMVGTYCCFDECGELLPTFVADADSISRYFAEELPQVTPEPFDRPVVAWFELAM